MIKLLIPCVVLLISCKYTQIYETTPSTKGITSDKYFVFENDTVKIKYSFWGESGSTYAYSFTNKLNIPLYIDWKKCSFIKNGAKYNYWEDITISKSTTSTWLFLGDFDLSTQFRKEISTRPERITFLAPKSAITRVWYSIYPFETSSISGKTCKLPINGSKKSQEVKCQDFTEENTRLKFRNFMTISTTEKFEKEYYIDNEFYVSKIYQMKNGAFAPILFEKPTWFYFQ
ncbi:MAG TPA: hypothetical protein VK483_12170 [Chitinophagaceae bacterium]|nr:hypothetical protein [Chitinophagaceae bacterium]